MSPDREIRPFRLALRTPFRGLVQRRGCLISGEHGWGEFAPFDDYGPRADARWLACAIEQADGRWPAPVRTSVEVNAIIPAVVPDQAAAMAVAAACRTVKVKVGDRDGTDRVAAVRQALPEAAIRVDANGAWSVPQATAVLDELAAFGLEYAEQPVATFEEMRQLRALVDVPLAADEVIRRDRRFADVREVADVAVLKVPTLGGVRRTLEAADRIGLPIVVSSALDSSIGLAAGLAAACALPEPPLACGLGTGALFAEDTSEPLLPVAGVLVADGYPRPVAELPVVTQDLDYWAARVAAAAEWLPD